MSQHSCSAMSQSVPIRNLKFRAIPGKEYNILLLGPVGVGKSTFINAFPNYLTFKSLDEASKNDPLSLIACKFCVSDENFQQKTVHWGSDPNENTGSSGQSTTQSCKAYEFPMENFLLRIIDTPGIGDKRGIDQDRQHLDGILGFISNYAELHAVCILLKPNEARLTPLFSYCNQQLLNRLHNNASNNIIFIFTNSRSTFYRPGNTAMPLKVLLERIRSTPPQPNIPYGKDNRFCLDNEAFRYLVALKNGINFSEHDHVNFGLSWTKSVEVSERLIRYIVEGFDGQGLAPHDVRHSLSVSCARNTIIQLAKPLADLTKNIQSDLEMLNRHRKDMEKYKADEEELKTMLYVPVVTLAIKDLEYPRITCSGANCRLPFNVGNQVGYHYPKKCNDPCYCIEDVPRDIIGFEGLRHCSAIDPRTANCNRCGCHYSVHLRLYSESKVIERKEVDPNIEKQLKINADIKQTVQDKVTKLEEEIKKYKADEKILTESTAKLAAFLKHNAMLVHNDSFKGYLCELIENEESLSKRGSHNAENIRGLNRKLDNYEMERVFLEKALKDTTSEHDLITTADVDKIIDDISKLKINVVTFK